MKRRTTVAFLLSILLLVPIMIHPIPIKAQEPDPIDGGITNPLAKVNATYARGDSWAVSYLGEGSYSWQSAPQRVFDGSHYVSYIFQDNYSTDGFYQVQSGLIGARIYDYYAKFYDPYMNEVRLYEEAWELQYWTGKKWSVCDTYSPEFTVSSDDTTVNITASFITDWPNNGERAFNLKYIFREGRALKHVIDFTSYSSEQYEFRVTQKWAGIVAAKVKHDTGEDIINSATIVDGSQFRFLKEDGSLSVFENQWDMYYGYNETIDEYYVLENENLKPIEIDVHAQGLKANFVFGNWTLAQGESLEIDPDTATLNNPTTDGDVKDDGTIDDTDDYMQIGRRTASVYRGFVEWDVISIPDAATITDTIFKYHGKQHVDGAHIHEMLGYQPSLGNGALLYAEAGEGTLYDSSGGFVVAGVTQQEDLGASADADLESQLASDWFAIGLQGDNEAGDRDDIYCEEKAGVNPPPTLYVEYSLAPTVTSASISDMDDGDNCYERKQYYTFSVVVDDPNGADTIANLSLRIMNGAVVLTEHNASTLDGVPAFSISQGTSIIEQDNASCSWGEAGDVGTATFKIMFEWDFVDIADLELSVFVMDEGGNSAGWTEMQSDYFDVIGRLVTSGFGSNSTYVPVGGGVQATGIVYYAVNVGGDVASTSFPPDAQFVYVSIHNSTHFSQGTNDTGVTNGEFSVDFSAPLAVGVYTYHAFLNLTDDYIPADAPDGDTFSITVISAALLLPFDDETGTIAYDWGGSSNDGTINGPTRTGCGIYGRALSFDGIDDYVVIPNSATLNITTAIYISAWINTGDAGVQGILVKNGSYGLSVLSNYALRFTLNTTNLDTAPNVFSANTWTFVAGWFNETQMSIIIDGVNTSSQVFNGPISLNNTDVFIGNLTTNYFNGTIDEVMILSSAPTLAEIVGLMWDPIATFPYNFQATITDMDCTDWVFVGDGYHFEGVFVRHNASYPLMDVSLMFTDGVAWTICTFDLVNDVWGLTSDGAYIMVNSNSSECNAFTAIWELYIGTGMFDEMDVDLWLYCEDNSTASDGYEIVEADYFNIYNNGGLEEYEYSGDGFSILGEGVFGLAAQNTGSWAYANITWRKLQHVGLLVHIWSNTSWDSGSFYFDCPVEHAETGSAEYGIDYWYNESWMTGWSVVLEIVDGAAGTNFFAVDSAWVQINATWYNGGDAVDWDTFYAFYEAHEQTDNSTQFALRVDLWIGLEEGSSKVAGRVRPEYFGIHEVGWGPWANWSPVGGLEDEAVFFDDLLDQDGGVISAGQLELFIAWANLTKITANGGGPDCDSHQWALIDYSGPYWRTLFVTDPMIGISSPLVPEAITPGDVTAGFFANLITAMIEGITKPIVNALGGGVTALYFFTAGVIDSAFLFFGIVDFMSSMSATIVAYGAKFAFAMANIVLIFVQIFRILGAVSGTLISWLTRMVSFLLQLGTIVSAILNGTQTGIGSLIDIWNLFEVNEWIDFIPIAIFISWVNAIDSRARKMGGGWMSIFIGDLQMASWIISFMVDWFSRVITFVVNNVFNIMNAIRLRIGLT